MDEINQIGNLEGDFFTFLDPRSGTIDCSLFRLLVDIMYDNFDTFDMQHIIDFCEYQTSESDGEVFKGAVALGLGEKFISAKVDFGELALFGLSMPNYHYNAFEKFEGNSIFFEDRSVESFLDESYPLGEAQLRMTIAAESEVERAFRHAIAEKPDVLNTIKKESFRRTFASNIGLRASDRVWSRVRADFPKIGVGGRKREKP